MHSQRESQDKDLLRRKRRKNPDVHLLCYKGLKGNNLVPVAFFGQALQLLSLS